MTDVTISRLEYGCLLILASIAFSHLGASIDVPPEFHWRTLFDLVFNLMAAIGCAIYGIYQIARSGWEVVSSVLERRRRG